MLGIKALTGKALYGLGCMVAAVVLVVSGVAYYGTNAVESLGTSPNLVGGPSTGAMNILIIGLESRTYWDGTSVDHHIATILHTGTAADGNGGNAANTLILLHVFAGGRKAVGFSIPRDAYVPMVGTLGFGTSPSKVDNAYGYAMAHQIASDLTAHPDWSSAQRNLDGNYAGQNAEIETVEALTGVTVNKFVELNLIGYYNMAQVFGGIEACVFPWQGGDSSSGYLAKNANLSDPVVGGATGGYGSGSEVVPGIQHLSPEQSLAFVRNRHTVPGGDNGRTYRQQAVIDYVLNNLKTGVMSDVSKLNSLLGSAKKYVQFPRNWNLVQFGGEISSLTPSSIRLTTLPTTGSETASNGVGAVSTVDIPAIQRIVQQAFSAPLGGGITKPAGSAKANTSAKSGTSSAVRAPAKPAPTALPAARVTVDAINNGAPTGTARSVLTALAAKGYTAGTAGNPPVGTPAQSLTTVSYGTGAAVNAAAIAKYFGPNITVTASSSLTADHVLVTLGVATQAVPASLAGPALTPASRSSGSGSASGGPASSGSTSSSSARTTSGAAPALTPREKQWAAEAKAKYGIPCVY